MLDTILKAFVRQGGKRALIEYFHMIPWWGWTILGATLTWGIYCLIKESIASAAKERTTTKEIIEQQIVKAYCFKCNQTIESDEPYCLNCETGEFVKVEP